MNDQHDGIPVIDREEDPNRIIPRTVKVEFKRLFNFHHYYYKARSSDTIGMLKINYQNAFKVRGENVYFYWEWMQLEDHQTLEFYGFRRFAEIKVYISDDYILLTIIVLLTGCVLYEIIPFFMKG
ncbi:unnamed protein product [Caenorhabditis nigoni]